MIMAPDRRIGSAAEYSRDALPGASGAARAGIDICRYDHIGLRVTDRARSLAFYAELGFAIDSAHSTTTAIEIVNGRGVRLNLIVNGAAPPEGGNILMDRPVKWPGYTHTAFIVDRLADVTEWAARSGVAVTEGPVDWGRRLTCFLRDPDANVLEFNELKQATSTTLVIGQKNYSSWSMRAWLLLRFLELEFNTVEAALYTESSRAEVRALGGETGLVPVLREGNLAIWDTLAIFEHLHETYGRVWPADPRHRAHARSLCGEVHSGLAALRTAMPVNLRAHGRQAIRTPEVEADIARVVEVWTNRRSVEGRWLFGGFGAADIMFAPIATRFETYDATLPVRARAYQRELLDHPLICEWFDLAAAERDEIACLETGRGGQALQAAGGLS
jgi:glutathione S-transferase